MGVFIVDMVYNKMDNRGMATPVKDSCKSLVSIGSNYYILGFDSKNIQLINIAPIEGLK